MARRQLTVFWGGDVLEVRVVTGTLPTFDPALTVRVETLDDVERLPPPRRGRITGATLASAIAHLGVLALVASYAHFRPADPETEHRERLVTMQGYLGRIAEHDSLAAGDVASDDRSDAVARDHGAHGGDALREDGMGALADAAGRAIDDRAPSLVPLMYTTNDGPHTGADPRADIQTSPSTLGPKIARKPRVSTGKGLAGGGGGGAGSGGASSCVAFASSALHDPQKSTWIEFELTDTAGRPVPNERYRVTLPDGTVREGLTDKRGLICFTGVDPGNAKIEFPNVDTTYVGSSPKPI